MALDQTRKRSSRYYGTDEDLLGQYAWYSGNSHQHAWPVGRLEPNDFGLFDMEGDVWQWCQDPYLPYPLPPSGQAAPDREFPDPPTLMGQRVARGGSFGDYASFVRCGFRNRFRAGNRYLYVGLRVARTLP